MTVLVLLSPRPASAIDPTTADCLAANEAAIALGNQTRLRDERAKLLVCAATSCPTDVRAECARRVGELNVAIPTIVFEARDAAGKDLAAVRVTVDGELLAERLAGTALSIDPGTHTFAFETSGQPRVEKELLIREGEKDRRERVAFGIVAPVAVASREGAAAVVVAPETATSLGLGSQRIGALVAAGVGVVGIGLGVGFGLAAWSKHDAANSACPTSQCAAQHGVDLWNQSHTAGNVSTVAFIVGGVGLAGAATLWLTAKPTAGGAPATQVGLGPGTLQLRGTW